MVDTSKVGPGTDRAAVEAVQAMYAPRQAAKAQTPSPPGEPPAFDGPSTSSAVASLTGKAESAESPSAKVGSGTPARRFSP